MTLRDLVDGLRGLDLARLQHEALAAQAGEIAQAVRIALDQTPGGPHDYPWRESGALHASIGSQSEGLEAEVGSTDPVAAWQEHGTPALPPRPFFGPVAEAHAEPAATAIAEAVVHALRSL